jgi:hypothetical protein
MFKNLIRFRLLDFFELTAAIAGALYVYQSTGWRDWEKLWVIGALAIAAIILWIATRLGKTAPTPGAFLATSVGVLYGLSDLSPWMAIFGRAFAIETLLSFYSKVTLGSLQERSITTVLVVGLLTIPALLFGAAWLTLWNLILILRKKYESFKRTPTLLFALAQAALTILFATGASYYLVRPQIRHVRTIRIPYTYAKTINSSIAAEPFDEAPFICDWSISSNGDSLFLLKSNKQFAEVDATTSEVLSSVTLDGQEFRSKRQYIGAGDNRKRLSISEAGGMRTLLWSFVNLAVYDASANDRRLLVEQQGQVQLFDGKTGKERSDLTKLPLITDHIFSTSPSRRFAVLTGANKGIGGPGQIVVDLREVTAFSKSNYVSAASIPGSDLEFYVNDTGDLTVQSKQGPHFGRGFDSKNEIELMFCGPSLRDCELECSADGAWRLSAGGLTAKTDETNLLKSYMDYNLHAAMDHSTGKVILLHNSTEASLEINPQPVPPILFTLLGRANRAQLTLFDPTTKTEQTSWLHPRLFQIPDSPSTQFTMDGRYLIIQDEDESADLFHIFSMP